MRARTMTMIGLVGASALLVAGIGASKPAGASTPTDKAAVQADEPNRPIASFIRQGVRRLVALRSDLNVTEDQKSQIKQIVQSHKAELVPAVRDVMSKRQALRAAVLAGDASEATIRAAADALGKSIGDAAVLASKIAAQVKPVLTDDQKQKLRDFGTQRQAAVGQLLDGALSE